MMLMTSLAQRQRELRASRQAAYATRSTRRVKLHFEVPSAGQGPLIPCGAQIMQPRKSLPHCRLEQSANTAKQSRGTSNNANHVGRGNLQLLVHLGSQVLV